MQSLHKPTPCAKSHKTQLFTDTSKVCAVCHKKDDAHKGILGKKCERCHGEKDWKKAVFDHNKTKFPLFDKHAKIKCINCHKDKKLKETPRSCIACHKKEDVHQGRFGPKCESCHTEKTFERKDFNHQQKTGYLLKLKHLKVPCLQCHIRPFYERRTSRVCVVCHRRDDVHEGALGQRCEICHSEAGFLVLKERR